VGGAGVGGGVDIQGGTLTISKSQIENNTARGGLGGVAFNSAGTHQLGGSAGGGAGGGGIYAGGGTLHLTLDVIQGNAANGGFGTGGHGPQSTNVSGGGLYKVTGTTLTVDSFTVLDLVDNTDSNPNDTTSFNFGTGPQI
jgi:hypothetical protein